MACLSDYAYPGTTADAHVLVINYSNVDVDALEKFLQEKYGRGIDLVVYTGTVVGSHSGPGTLAIFFVGKER